MPTVYERLLFTDNREKTGKVFRQFSLVGGGGDLGVIMQVYFPYPKIQIITTRETIRRCRSFYVLKIELLLYICSSNLITCTFSRNFRSCLFRKFLNIRSYKINLKINKL